MDVVQEYPDNATADSLMENERFLLSLTASIAEGLTSVGHLTFYFDTTIVSLKFSAFEGVRRLGHSSRRLKHWGTYLDIPRTLTVRYKIKVSDADAAAALQDTMKSDSARASFVAAFIRRYTELEIVRTGSAPIDLQVTQSTVWVTVVETRIIVTTSPPNTTNTSPPIAVQGSGEEDSLLSEDASVILGTITFAFVCLSALACLLCHFKKTDLQKQYANMVYPRGYDDSYGEDLKT